MRQGFRMSVNEKNIHPFVCLMTKSPAVDSELGFRITAWGSAIGASLRCTVDKLHRPGRLFHRLYVECGISFRPCIHSIVAEIGIDQIMSHESIDTAAVPGHIFRSRTGKNIIRTGKRGVVLYFPVQSVCKSFIALQSIQSILPATASAPASGSTV